MDALVVQSGIRHGRFAEVTRSLGSSLSIGRAYSNDLVLTAPYIAAKQLMFRYEEDQWWLFIPENTNTVHINGKAYPAGRVTFSSGDQITIGRTKLLVFNEGHEISPTIGLTKRVFGLARSYPPLAAVALLLTFAVINLGFNYFEGSTDLEWKQGASDVLALTIGAVVWAGIWSMVGYVSRHQQEFWSQLVVSAAVLFTIDLLLVAGEFTTLSWNNQYKNEVVSSVVFFISICTILCLNLSIALDVKRPIIISFTIISLVYSVIYANKFIQKGNPWQNQPKHSRSIKPPLVTVFKGKDIDDYWQHVLENTEQ